MRRVVRPGPGDYEEVATLGAGHLEQPQLLRVAQRRALAGGAGHDDAVGAIVGQVAEQAHERLLVDPAARVERRDHCCEHPTDQHGPIIPILPNGIQPLLECPAKWQRLPNAITATARRSRSSPSSPMSGWRW